MSSSSSIADASRAAALANASTCISFDRVVKVGKVFTGDVGHSSVISSALG
jgi:hypothetical protein